MYFNDKMKIHYKFLKASEIAMFGMQCLMCISEFSGQYKEYFKAIPNQKLS